MDVKITCWFFKSGKSGPDVPAPREALYLCMRERGNGTDGLESPEIFRTKCDAYFPNQQTTWTSPIYPQD